MRSIKQQQYQSTFNKLYSIAKEFSQKRQVSLDDVFYSVMECHFSNYSSDKIRQYLKESFYGGTFKPYDLDEFDVWLTFGETGQGKSTFVNAVCGKQVAVEGSGIDSQTKDIRLYESKHKIIVIDTPGLFDTRFRNNHHVSDELVEMVQNRLKQNANIRAIFFIWCPTASNRFRFDQIKEELEKTLGKNALNSVIFLVNKRTKQWTECHEEAYQDFLKKLDENNLKNPVALCDLKLIGSTGIHKLKHWTERVVPYRKEDFESYRMQIYYIEFMQAVKKDEEDKKKTYEVEERVRAGFQKQIKELKDKNNETLREKDEKFQRDLRNEREANSQKIEELEREHKINRRDFETRCDSLQSENYRMRQEMEKARNEYQENLAKKEREQSLANENRQRLEQENERRRLEREFYREEPQGSTIEIMPVLHYETYPSSSDLWGLNPYQGPYESQPSPINLFGGSSGPVAFESGMKHYKGGQFIPGGGHAPKGGIDLPVNCSSLNNFSAESLGSVAPQCEMKHYKGGQFIPGGGHAPKGGIDLPVCK